METNASKSTTHLKSVKAPPISTQELKNVRVELAEAQDKCEALQSTFQELEISHNEMTSKIGSMRRKLVKKKVQSKNAQEKLSTENAGHLQMQKKIIKTEKQIATNKSQLAKSLKKQTQLQALLDEAVKAEIPTKVENAGLDVKELDIELERLQTQRQRLESGIKSLQLQKKEVSRLQVKIDRDVKQSASLDEKCEEMRQKDSQLNVEIAASKKRLCEQNTRLKQCKEAMQSTAVKIQNLDAQIGVALRKSSQNRFFWQGLNGNRCLYT